MYLRKTTSSAGILIPEIAQDPQGYGRVVSVGLDAANKEIKLDDILIFHTRAGMDMIQGKTVLKVVKYEEVYGILHDEDLASRLEPLEFKGKSEQSNIVAPAPKGIVIAS